VESLNESCSYVKLCYIQTTCYFVFESVNVYVAVNEHDWDGKFSQPVVKVIDSSGNVCFDSWICDVNMFGQKRIPTSEHCKNNARIDLHNICKIQHLVFFMYIVNWALFMFTVLEWLVDGSVFMLIYVYLTEKGQSHWLSPFCKYWVHYHNKDLLKKLWLCVFVTAAVKGSVR